MFKWFQVLKITVRFEASKWQRDLATELLLNLVLVGWLDAQYNFTKFLSFQIKFYY